MKIFVLIYIIYSIPLCFGMDYDEKFTTGLKRLYKESQSFTIVYKLILQENDYYEIHNANCILTIYKGENQVAKLESISEEAYYFKYDSNYVYYIKFEFPYSSYDFYAFYVSTGDEELNTLSSSLILRFAERRDFSIKIKNKEKTPQIIKIEILFGSGDGIVSSTSIVENGNKFSPPSTKDDYYSNERRYSYYAIITNELTFETYLYYQYYLIYQFQEAKLCLYYETNLISENTNKCLSKGRADIIEFYKINPPSDKDYYEISYKGSLYLYYVKNNTYKERITSINKYKIKTYEYFLAEIYGNEACFSILFSDKNNTIERFCFKYTFI